MEEDKPKKEKNYEALNLDDFDNHEKLNLTDDDKDGRQ